MGCLSAYYKCSVFTPFTCMYFVHVQVTTVDSIMLLEEEIATYHKETAQLITKTRAELRESKGRVMLICCYEILACVIST